MKEMIFETLVVGEFNKFTYSAAIEYMEKNIAFNPLVIQAKTGLGKTHILKAILNKAKETNPQEIQIYTTCQNFVEEFIESIRKSDSKSFRKKYRNAQLIMIDDIQFLSRKAATQEELSLLFDYWSDHGVQIVLSLNCDIAKISGLSKNLESRLRGGIVTVIKEPEYDDRRKILETVLLERNKMITSEVIDYIAENMTSNIRSLKGALYSMLTYQDFSNVEVTVETVGNLLKIGNQKEENRIVLMGNSLSGYKDYSEQNDSTLLRRIIQMVKEGCKLTLYSVDGARVDEITEQLDEIPNVETATHWL